MTSKKERTKQRKAKTQLQHHSSIMFSATYQSVCTNIWKVSRRLYRSGKVNLGSYWLFWSSTHQLRQTENTRSASLMQGWSKLCLVYWIYVRMRTLMALWVEEVMQRPGYCLLLIDVSNDPPHALYLVCACVIATREKCSKAICTGIKQLTRLLC